MDVRASQQDLAFCLQTVRRAVSSETIIPVLSGILVEALEDRLVFSATDTQIRIECSARANVVVQGSVVLPAKYFAEIIKRIPETEIQISLKDNQTIEITWAKAQYVLQGLPVENFPGFTFPDGRSTIAISQGALRTLIRRTAFCTARDESRVVLTGALFGTDEDSVQMVATDGVRLSRATVQVEESAPRFEAVVPYRTLTEMVRICSGESEDMAKIYVTDKHIILDTMGIRLVSTVLQGTFPDYQRVFPDKFVSFLSVPRSTLHDALDRAALLSQSSGSSAVRILARDGHISVTSSVPEVGQVVEQIDGHAEGEEVDVFFNARYVMDGLKVIDGDEVLFSIPEPEKASIIKVPGDDSYSYLVLPLRVG